MSNSFDIYFSVRNCDLQLFTALTSSDRSLLRTGHLGRSWLHYAAIFGCEAIATHVLAQGADVNALEDDVEVTPLDRAAMSGQTGVARLLLRAGARILPTGNGVTGTIIDAVNSGCLELVDLLLEHGADPNATYGDPPRNALSHAIDRNYSVIAELLRSRGAILPPPTTVTPLTNRDELLRHFETHVGPVSPLGLVEIVPGAISISIHTVSPGPGHYFLTLFTSGASDKPLSPLPSGSGDSYVEFMIHLPSDWPIDREALLDHRNSWPIEWLRRSALYFHERRTSIGLGHCVVVNGEPPRPLGTGVEFDSLLLLERGGDFPQVQFSDGRRIALYTLYPLYPGERLFEAKHGPAPLIQRLEKGTRFPIVDTHRTNVSE